MAVPRLPLGTATLSEVEREAVGEWRAFEARMWRSHIRSQSRLWREWSALDIKDVKG